MEFKILDNIDNEIMQLRRKTFVIEKNIPREIEFDGKDAEFMHFCLYDNNELIAYARVNVVEDKVHAGRVAVKREYRRKGLGALLFKYIEEYAVKECFKEIELSAVETAVVFYEKIGFKTVGEYFIEAGWPHIYMTKKIAL